MISRNGSTLICAGFAPSATDQRWNSRYAVDLRLGTATVAPSRASRADWRGVPGEAGERGTADEPGASDEPGEPDELGAVRTSGPQPRPSAPPLGSSSYCSSASG